MRLRALWEVLSRYSNVDYDALVEIYKRIMKYKGLISPRDFIRMIMLILGVNSEKAVQEAVVAYEESTYSYKPRVIPGAHELLEYAKSRKLKVIVVSNTSFSALGVIKLLENAGLGEYVDYVASSADLGLEKPNPKIFQLALRAVNVEPHEAVHVGDSCGRDILGSMLAGLNPILYARSWSGLDLCRALKIPIINRLEEAIEILENLARS